MRHSWHSAMRRLPIASIAALVALAGLAGGARCLAADPAPAAKPEMKTVADKASYAIGISLGRDFKQRSIPVNVEMIIQGFRDTMSERPSALTDKEAQAALQQFQEEVAAQLAAEAKVAGEKGKKEGAAFLAANGKKPDVKTTASGLQYKVVKQGAGPKPTLNDAVRAHYRGTLLDGKEFDSSYARNEPITFPLRNVIPGWTEALQLMPTGSKWQLFIPAELAYGEEGRPGIPPNATLVFDVELLDVISNKDEAVPPARPRVQIKQ